MVLGEIVQQSAALLPTLDFFPTVSSEPVSERDAYRVMDITVVVLALLALGPLMLLLALTIYCLDAGPIMFAQQRIGRNGRTFSCYKFRTMVPDAEARLSHLLATDADAQIEWARDRKLRRDPRITRIGNFLRKSSLDELPQIFNVLRGDMSIVGPRPIIASEVPLYGRAFRNYCSVRPGITGLWQTSGRNDVSYRRRVALDVMYTRKKSVGLDLRIMAMTVPAVILERGSY